MIKISIIIPVFNGERFIKKAIESVLNQNFKDFELIIVNDGSTDDTLNIIKEFEDDRISVVSQENMGPGASRNNALKMASGEYVMFLDSDDWLCPDSLRIAYGEAYKNNTDISIFQIIKYHQGQYGKNDWFSLNNFPKDFENRVFNPMNARIFYLTYP